MRFILGVVWATLVIAISSVLHAQSSPAQPSSQSAPTPPPKAASTTPPSPVIPARYQKFRGFTIGQISLTELRLNDVAILQREYVDEFEEEVVKFTVGSGYLTIYKDRNRTDRLLRTRVSGTLKARLKFSQASPNVPVEIAFEPDGLRFDGGEVASTLQFAGGTYVPKRTQLRIWSESPVTVRPGGTTGMLFFRTSSSRIEHAKLELGSAAPVDTLLVTGADASGIVHLPAATVEMLKGTFDGPPTIAVQNTTLRVGDYVLTAQNGTIDNAKVQFEGRTSTWRGDIHLTAPTVRSDSVPDLMFAPVLSATAVQSRGDVVPSAGKLGVTVASDTLRLEPDRPKIIDLLNEGVVDPKLLVATGAPEARFIRASDLHQFYTVLAKRVDDPSGASILVMRVHDGLIEVVLARDLSVVDPGMTDPPAMCALLSDATSEIVSEAVQGLLLMTVVAPATVATGISVSAALTPVVGIPAAWAVAGTGIVANKAISELAGGLTGGMAEWTCELLLDPYQSALKDPRLRNGYYELLPLTNDSQRPPLPKLDKLDGQSLGELRRSVVAQIAPSSVPNATVSQSAIDQFTSALYAHEVNAKGTRAELPRRASDYSTFQADRFSRLAEGQQKVETSRAQYKQALLARNGQINSAIQAESKAAIQDSIDTMRSKLSYNSDTGFGSGGVGSNMSTGWYFGGNDASGGATGSSNGGGAGSMGQGSGCRQLYQPCFQLPKRVVVEEESPIYVFGRPPKKK